MKKIYIKAENTGFCYQIPLKLTSKDFHCIKKYHIDKKSYSIEEKRQQHKDAYNKWTLNEDEILKDLFYEKKSLKDLCSIFGRNEEAIKSRIEKLGL